MEQHDYARFPGFWEDSSSRKRNLWGYIDARDVAQVCRRSLEADIQGAEAFIVAAADTVMNRPSRELLAEFYPGTSLRDGIGEFDTLLGIDKARRLLGYEPEYSWREHVQ
jgi:nucleoside-diphosphate-sugar epimerase